MQLTTEQYQKLITIDAKCINPMFAGQTIEQVQARIDEGITLKSQHGESPRELTNEQKENVKIANNLTFIEML
jgi:hypothetical protein